MDEVSKSTKNSFLVCNFITIHNLFPLILGKARAKKFASNSCLFTVQSTNYVQMDYSSMLNFERSIQRKYLAHVALNSTLSRSAVFHSAEKART